MMSETLSVGSILDVIDGISNEEVPEVAIFDPLVLPKMLRSHLKNIVCSAEEPALIIGWHDERVIEFVEIVNHAQYTWPTRPPYINNGDLTVS